MQQVRVGLKAVRGSRCKGTRVGVTASIARLNLLGRLICVFGFLTSLLEAGYLVGLGALGALDDVEFNFITLFEALIALSLDGTVVNEDVSPALAAEEAVALCVVKPLNCALVLCQWSSSLDFVSEPTDTGSESAATVT
jgi:hypothetical protein